MTWVIIAVIYALIGIGVFVWRINKDKKINPKSVTSFEKIMIIPELFVLLAFLLWPFVLFSEIKHRRRGNHIGNGNTGGSL